MKIFIITEGGRNIGFGHVARCVSLAQAFLERGISSEFILNGDKSLSGLLKGRKYTFFNWVKDKKKLFSLIKGAEVAIVDSYLAGEGIYKRIAELADLPVFVDDNKRLNYPKGLLINGSIYAQNINYPTRKGLTYLLGSQYALLRKEFWDTPRRKVKNSIGTIMVTFGGDDEMGLTPRVTEFLNKNYPDMVKNIVIGKGFQNTEGLERLLAGRVNFIYSPDAARMKSTMLEADIAICAAGQTLYELARTGTPAIATSVARNQLKNAKGFERAGLINYIGSCADRSFLVKLKNAIKKFESVNIRRNRSKRGQECIDGKGALRAAREILSQYYRQRLELRKARLDDAAKIFHLSNENIVRKNSLHTGTFSWDHHLRWFRKKIRDKDCVFLILEASKEFVGQSRFHIDPTGKKATVNLSLAKHTRSLGLSSFVAERSVAELMKKRGDIQVVTAYVKKGNTPSCRCFEGAGFRRLENIVIKGAKTRVYVKKPGENGIHNKKAEKK